MAGIPSMHIRFQLSHFAKNLVYTSSTAVNKEKKHGKGHNLVNVYWVSYCGVGTAPNIPSAFIPGRELLASPLWQMRKSSHTAKAWGKEDLNLGLNLKPMLLTTVCNSSHTAWQTGQWVGFKGCLLPGDCSEKKCSPDIPVSETWHIFS